ncbi:MAG TPA: hypothetical protein VGK10_01870 [Prolixibacteraceae bacterium]|jgi:hypothetical protein
MRYLILTWMWLIIFQGYSQTPGTILLSAVVVGPDSVPVPDVAIINTRTGHAVHTNKKGFFQTEIAGDDSVFIYHIAYKRQFANENDNGKIIMLEPQIYELNQLDVTEDAVQNMKNLQQTLKDSKRLAPEKKFAHSDYTDSSRQSRFVRQNGSHDKGFKEFFGPTVHLPVEKIVASLSGSDDKRERKKLTSHYHLVKKKDNDKEK